LTDGDVDTILKLTGTEEDLDGNIKYEGSIGLCTFRRDVNTRPEVSRPRPRPQT